MAFLIKNGVIINDERELVGVSTAGITTALYVGENIQLDALSGVITATKYEGSGADLTDIVATVLVSDGIPTGISTAEGDLYYDSTDLTLFTYYDNNWVEATPVPPGATELQVSNAAGISTISVDLLTEALKLDGTSNEVTVSLNPGTDSVTFGLASEVAIAGSMTAGTFYGDGSGLTGLQITSGQFIEVGGVQAGVITATTSLQATGAGTGLDVTNDASIGGSLTLSGVANLNGGAALGNTDADLISAQGRFITDLVPLLDNSVDLGSATNQWADIYLGGNASIGSSVTAASFYGGGLDVTNNANIGGTLTVNGDITGDGATSISGISSVTTGAVYSPVLEAIGLDNLDIRAENNNRRVSIQDAFSFSSSAVLSSKSQPFRIIGGGEQTTRPNILLGNGDGVTIDGGANSTLGLGIDLLGGGGNGAVSVTQGNFEVTEDIKANGNIIGDALTNISGINSVTATSFYGDGSNLTGIGLDPAGFYEVAGVQAGIVTVSNTLDLNGNIVGNFTNLVSGINTIQTVDLTVNSLGTLKFNDAEATDGTAFMDFRAGSSAELALRLGSDLNPASSLYHLGEPTGAGTRISTQDDGIRFTGLIQIGESVVAGAGASEQGLRFGFGSSGQIVTEISTDLSGTNLDTELVTALAVETALGSFNTGSATTVTSFDDQAATDYPMPFLSAVGAGASIYTDSTANEEFTYNPSTGILKVKEFDALSDARLKTDIVRVDGALDKVAQLRGVEYNWKNGSGASVGVIAQEVQEVYPQLVNDSGERLTVNYNGLVGLLIAAVNEMSAELAELKAQK